jgi:hypothetical protein
VKTQGRGLLAVGTLGIVAGAALAVLGFVGDRDEWLVRGGLFLTLGLFAIYAARSGRPPRR